MRRNAFSGTIVEIRCLRMVCARCDETLSGGGFINPTFVDTARAELVDKADQSGWRKRNGKWVCGFCCEKATP